MPFFSHFLLFCFHQCLLFLFSDSPFFLSPFPLFCVSYALRFSFPSVLMFFFADFLSFFFSSFLLFSFSSSLGQHWVVAPAPSQLPLNIYLAPSPNQPILLFLEIHCIAHDCSYWETPRSYFGTKQSPLYLFA